MTLCLSIYLSVYVLLSMSCCGSLFNYIFICPFVCLLFSVPLFDCFSVLLSLRIPTYSCPFLYLIPFLYSFASFLPVYSVCLIVVLYSCLFVSLPIPVYSCILFSFFTHLHLFTCPFTLIHLYILLSTYSSPFLGLSS